MKNDKTNVMRVLEQKRIPYIAHSYESDPSLSGEEIAGILKEDAGRVFKTLVTQGKSGQYRVTGTGSMTHHESRGQVP